MTIRIKTLKDVERIETVPLEERLPGNTGYEILLSTVARFPDRVAITALDEGELLGKSRDITFTELLANVHRAANMLRSRGLKSGESVTHFLPLVPEAFYVKIAAETVGIVNPVNPMLEVEHIVGITQSANSRILVVPGKEINEEFFNKGKEIVAANPNIHTVFVLGGKDECDGELFLPLEYSISEQDGSKILDGVTGTENDLAAYFHTGGTTGVPKLAQHTQRMRIAQTVSTGMMVGFDEQDCVLLGLPMFHVAGSIILGEIPLLCGSRVLLLSPEGFRDRAAILNFWKLIEAQKVTVLMAVPTVLSALLNVPVNDADLSSLRLFLTGGAAVPLELIRAMSAHIGIEVGQGFGMTEMGGMALLQTQHSETVLGSAGFRGPYIQVKIGIQQPDGEVKGEAAPNEIGVLCFKGPCMMPGYAGGRAQAETFTEDGWLNTGDLARMDGNGEVRITGRSKDVIIRGGHNIDPMMIEDALMMHPAVEMVAAVGKPDLYAGELPVAYVQLKAGQNISPEALVSFARETIVERAAVPCEAILIEQMPKTGIDKIFKPALRVDIIKRTYEGVIAGDPDISVDAAVRVENDPLEGLLAKVCLSGDKCQHQEARVASVLNHFTTPFSVEWEMR